MQNGNQHKTTKPTKNKTSSSDDSKEKPCGTRTEHVHFFTVFVAGKDSHCPE